MTPINCALTLVCPPGPRRAAVARKFATVTGGSYYECNGTDLDRPELHYPDADTLIVTGLPQTETGRARLALLVAGHRTPDVILCLDDTTPRSELEFLGDRRVRWHPCKETA